MSWRIPLSDVRISTAQRTAADEVLASGWLSMGPRTAAFETAFAEQVGVEHAIAVSNASAGLLLALQASGVGPGCDVVVPSLTFVADANAIVSLGAHPVFADIVRPDRPVIDPAALHELVGPRTKAVLVVHYGGYRVDMESLLPLRDRGVALIEDAAHAVGPAAADGRWLPLTGDMAVYSFFANKNMPLGEGGMVVTNSADLATEIRLYRSHGMTALTWDRHLGRATDYDVTRIGWNVRPTELTSAIGQIGLDDLPQHNNARRAVLERYRAGLAGSSASLIFGPEDATTAHLAVVVVPPARRDDVRTALRDASVEVSFHYPPIHRFSAYAERGTCGDLRQTDAAATQLLSLPIHPWLTDAEVDSVIETITRAIGPS
jgi:dTDP-4-amino-4,6-dideoxygalactose transaminase